MSTKRKVVGETLQRRVRARREPSEEVDSDDSLRPNRRAALDISDASDSDSASNASEEKDQERDEATAEEDDDEDSDYDEESDDEPSNPTATISFGALAKAQASLSKPPKSSSTKNKGDSADAEWWKKEAIERKEGRKDHRDHNRSSKHAPTEISSKKAVSRMYQVVPVAKREARDPRFEPLVGQGSRGGPREGDDSRVRQAYSFLEDYREDEMKELKAAIRKTTDETAKEKLKRALMKMESRKKAQTRKDKEKEILTKHRREEKELVKAGKQPFYLKKDELKKRVLVEQFGELKGKGLDRVIERRRKKVEGKEKKKMPWARRETGTQ